MSAMSRSKPLKSRVFRIEGMGLILKTHGFGQSKFGFWLARKLIQLAAWILHLSGCWDFEVKSYG